MHDPDHFFEVLKLFIEKGIRVEVQQSDNPMQSIRANDKNGVEHLYIPSGGAVLLHNPYACGKLKVKELYGVSTNKFIDLLENPKRIQEIFRREKKYANY